jgi:hypothetical protein
MKNPELYHKTISILVKSYLENTLVHGNCQACAVGNLIAGNLNYKYSKPIDEDLDQIKWDHCDSHRKEIFWYGVLGTAGGRSFLNLENYEGIAKSQIDITGYSPQELLLIENRFESTYKYFPTDSERENMMYNGLMAVVEALGEIHEVSKELTEETKLMFVKA